MNISVKFVSPFGEEMDAQRCESLVRTRTTSALDCFDTSIEEVLVTIRDLNGEKGGIDLEASVAISLHHHPSVHVSAVAATLDKAIADALAKASRVVSKRKDRKTRKGARIAASELHAS